MKSTGRFDPESKVTRKFLILCRSKRGAKHLLPESVVEIKDTPEGYEYVGNPSPYFGSLRGPLEKRGDLVQIESGDRITRTPHVGKSVEPANRPYRGGEGRRVFVTVTVPVSEWHLFTKRTEQPKLGWLLRETREAGLRVVESGKSWHAPITWVHRDDLDAAWKILGPVDDVPDDDPRFG